MKELSVFYPILALFCPFPMIHFLSATLIQSMNKFVRDCTNLSLRNCLIADGYLGSNTFGIFYNDIVVKDNKGK